MASQKLILLAIFSLIAIARTSATKCNANSDCKYVCNGAGTPVCFENSCTCLKEEQLKNTDAINTKCNSDFDCKGLCYGIGTPFCDRHVCSCIIGKQLKASAGPVVLKEEPLKKNTDAINTSCNTNMDCLGLCHGIGTPFCDGHVCSCIIGKRLKVSAERDVEDRCGLQKQSRCVCV